MHKCKCKCSIVLYGTDQLSDCVFQGTLGLFLLHTQKKCTVLAKSDFLMI